MDFAVGSSSVNGNVTVNVLPTPGWEYTVTVPLQRCTISLTMESPKPFPWIAWERSP